MNFWTEVFLDIEISDMAADSARKAQIHTSLSTGIAEAAVMRYLRIDQFDHLGAVAGFLILTEYISSIPEFDKNTGRAPLHTHSLIVRKYCPGHGMRRTVKVHGRHRVAVGP